MYSINSVRKKMDGHMKKIKFDFYPTPYQNKFQMDKRYIIHTQKKKNHKSTRKKYFRGGSIV